MIVYRHSIKKFIWGTIYKISKKDKGRGKKETPMNSYDVVYSDRRSLRICSRESSSP